MQPLQNPPYLSFFSLDGDVGGWGWVGGGGGGGWAWVGVEPSCQLLNWNMQEQSA
jgi:hypothetical protein